MLALAAPPLHDHSVAHTAPVTAGKTPIVRSKPAARRAPSSASLSSATPLSSVPSSSSSSSASSSSTVVPLSASRTASVSHFRSEPSLAAKRQSLSPKSTQPKLVDLETSYKNSHLSGSSMLASLPAKNESITDLQSYPTPDLLRLLASLLNQIATANDGLSSSHSHGPHQAGSRLSPSAEHPPIWQSLFSASRVALSTPTSSLTFHARNIPSITLQAYLLRILRYCPTTNEVFLSLLVYFDRMSKLAQEATGTRFVIDSYNVHRLVIAGVTVASKFFSDVFYTNSRYARVSLVPAAFYLFHPSVPGELGSGGNFHHTGHRGLVFICFARRISMILMISRRISGRWASAGGVESARTAVPFTKRFPPFDSSGRNAALLGATYAFLSSPGSIRRSIHPCRAGSFRVRFATLTKHGCL